MQFGRSSEKLHTELAQLELALEELETAASVAQPQPEAHQKAPEPRAPQRRLPDSLPRASTKGWCLHLSDLRTKFSCRNGEAITQAPAQDKPIAGGKATFRLIAHLIMSKWDHHLPLYRQAEMFPAQGFNVDRSTLAGWVGQGYVLLQPIADRNREIGLQVSKLHVDDTPVPMLDPGAGKTKTARLWCHAVDDRALAGATFTRWFGSVLPIFDT